MRAVMYHYVRQCDPAQPYFLYLDFANFLRQVRHFAENGGLVSPQEFAEIVASGKPPIGKFLLTFDDGLVDHYAHVMPVLRAFDAAGIFYVSTAPYTTRKPLAVHLSHVLLGRVSGAELLAKLRQRLTPDMLVSGADTSIVSHTYRRQTNAAETTLFKRLVNYQIKYSVLDEVLLDLAEEVFPEAHDLVQQLYLTPEQIDQMVSHGMIVGAHAISHRSLARLSESEWHNEIDESLDVVRGLTAGRCPRTFCYPYGGSHNYPTEAPEYLARRGCSFSFDVNPQEITAAVWMSSRQALPRFDCNQFPHGSISGGWRA